MRRQLSPPMLFFRADEGRNLDGDPGVKIASPAASGGQALAPNAQLLPLLGAGGNLHGNGAFQCPHRNCCPQHRFPRGQLELAHQIGAARAPIRMLGVADQQVDVSGAAAMPPLPGTRIDWPS